MLTNSLSGACLTFASITTAFVAFHQSLSSNFTQKTKNTWGTIAGHQFGISKITIITSDAWKNKR